VLHFNPTPATEMVIACLWDRWQPPGQPAALESFAAITDEPPPEIAATGHNRCIVPLQPAAVTAWLDPQHQEPASLQQLLDRRERPYYAYELAA
jgi:putative SOS response-associated peptidase YedK